MRTATNPFRYRAFNRYWLARFCSMNAQNAMVIVIGWQVYDIARLSMGTRDAAFQLGLVGLAQFLPLFALAPVSGWIIDKLDRRLIFGLCIALQFGCAAILGVLTLVGAVTLGRLFGVAVLLGVARAFSMPSSGALVSNLVPLEALPRAIASGTIAGRAGAILGPAGGGVLYTVAAQAPYFASTALYAVSVACVVLIGPVERVRLDSRESPWRQMLEGLAYVVRHKLILGAISLDLVAVLLGGATALLPIYARDILHVGAAGLGQLRAAPAIGAILAGLWFAGRPLRHNVGPKMLAAVAVFGLATIGFGLSRSMPLSLVCLVVLGAADMLSVHVRQSLIQLSTPDHMRGRVGAVASLFVSASNELGEAESGFLSAALGPVATVTIGGVAAVIAAGVWYRLFPALPQARSYALVRPVGEDGHGLSPWRNGPLDGQPAGRSGIAERDPSA